MRRLIIPALLLLLGAGSPAVAQPYGPAGGPAALVRSWYHQFMNRDADPQGLSDWTDQLRRGMSPEIALTHFLTSAEYFQRSGNTTEGWIWNLLTDLTGREPSQREYDYWLYRATTDSSRDVVYELVTRYWQPQGGGYGGGHAPYGAGQAYDPYTSGYRYDPYSRGYGYGATIRYRR